MNLIVALNQLIRELSGSGIHETEVVVTILLRLRDILRKQVEDEAFEKLVEEHRLNKLIDEIDPLGQG